MIGNITFYNPQNRDMDLTISEIFGDERESVVKKLKEMDRAHGYIPNKSCHANSYDNDDYLFVADMLQDVRELHTKIYFDPQKQEWVRGNREIPYIHLDFIEKGTFEYDNDGSCVPNDKSLNMGVGGPNEDGSHILSFNYYWLRRYLRFLQIVFDDNEDEVVDLPGIPTQKNEYKTKQELLATVISLQSLGLHEQAEWLKMYINSFPNDNVVAPILMNIGGNKKYVWGFFDESGTKFRIPMKKTIYNTSGFAPLFHNRTSLVSELFVNSLKMILAHETAHVARGHWLLRQNEPQYSQSRNVMMNCEINADWTAAHWLLNELLYDTRLQKEDMICVYRYEQMKYAFEEICEVLSESNIEYIPLKGAVIRPYYPIESMRTSCDIDILIREEDLDNAIERLRQKEYRFESKNFHDVSLYSPNNVHLELHFNIQENMDNLDSVLKDAWKYAVPSEKSRCAFTNEFLTFHIFAHMAYHFISGGCGIRSLMDIWVMERKMGVTYSCAEDLLKKAGIYQFATQMSKLAQQCFSDNQTDDFSDMVLEYIFDGGMYGNMKNHIAVKKSKDENTFTYVIKRLFLPYKSMTTLFPILNKVPILLPFCWVIRWIRALFSKNARKTISEISVANDIKNSKVEEIKKINSGLGL